MLQRCRANQLATAFSALSLLALGAVSVLWIRSQNVFDYIYINPNEPVEWSVALEHDQLILFRVRNQVLTTHGRLVWLSSAAGASNIEPASLPYLERARPGVDGWFLVMPYWTLAVAAGAFPVMRLLRAGASRWKRSRRRRAGRCLLCGYDLRASCGTCPECGATIAQRPSSA